MFDILSSAQHRMRPKKLRSQQTNQTRGVPRSGQQRRTTYAIYTETVTELKDSEIVLVSRHSVPASTRPIAFNRLKHLSVDVSLLEDQVDTGLHAKI